MGFAHGTGLQKLGILNRDTPDLRDLMFPVTNVIRTAYCSSRECAGNIPKNVKKEHAAVNAATCPDCGSILYWESTHADMPQSIAEKAEYICRMREENKRKDAERRESVRNRMEAEIAERQEKWRLKNEQLQRDREREARAAEKAREDRKAMLREAYSDKDYIEKAMKDWQEYVRKSWENHNTA